MSAAGATSPVTLSPMVIIGEKVEQYIRRTEGVVKQEWGADVFTPAGLLSAQARNARLSAEQVSPEQHATLLDTVSNVLGGQAAQAVTDQILQVPGGAALILATLEQVNQSIGETGKAPVNLRELLQIRVADHGTKHTVSGVIPAGKSKADIVAMIREKNPDSAFYDGVLMEHPDMKTPASDTPTPFEFTYDTRSVGKSRDTQKEKHGQNKKWANLLDMAIAEGTVRAEGGKSLFKGLVVRGEPFTTESGGRVDVVLSCGSGVYGGYYNDLARGPVAAAFSPNS